MNECEIVKHIMMLNDITYDDLSVRLGYKSKSSAYKTLNGLHMYVDTFRKYLKELGYELVVRKSDSDNKEEYIVTEDSYPSPLRFHDMELGLDRILK